MDTDKGITLLKEQIEKGKAIAVPPAFNPQYKVWEQTTRRILNSILDKETVRLFTSVLPQRMYSTEDEALEVFGDVLGRKLKILEEIILEHERLFGSGISLSRDEGSQKPHKTKQDSRKIFVVHGHDSEMKEKVARFLESIELIPIVLHEQPNQGKTIIEKFEEYSDVSFSVVLLSPDDLGKAKGESKDEYRARQNVIFEFGYFIGMLGRQHVCGLKKGSIQLPSDYSGIIYIDFDPNDAWKFQLAKELNASGISVDMNRLL